MYERIVSDPRYKDGRVDLHARVTPEARAEMDTRAVEQFGGPRKVGALLEATFVTSRPYEATPDQASDPVLLDCWARRLTESATIVRCAEEMAQLRDRVRRLESEIEECECP
jgi:hypothetical protein